MLEIVDRLLQKLIDDALGLDEAGREEQFVRPYRPAKETMRISRAGADGLNGVSRLAICPELIIAGLLFRQTTRSGKHFELA